MDSSQKRSSTIALIPARGGSKGLPRKNLLPICGKPLIAWSIEAALNAAMVDSVYVTTDDPEIAAVSRKYGAEVIERPADLSGDTATSEAALLHALAEAERGGVLPELMVFLQCTSPLTTFEDIDRAVETLNRAQADSCFTASEFHHFIWKSDSKEEAVGINHDKRHRPRRQDRDPQYIENGAVYVMRVSGFRQACHRFFGKTVFSLMPAQRSAEIDDAVDLSIVEMLLRGELVHKRAAQLPEKIEAVAFDFDGVFTDNGVSVDQTGVESVRVDRSDGWGLAQLRKTGIKIVVLSTELNPVVAARCGKLAIECRQGLGEKKLEAFENWCAENELSPQNVIFVGNDVNDIEAMNASGCGMAPADAYPEARAAARIMLAAKGGRGAVRDVCDLIVSR